LLRRESELSLTYGAKHPQIVKLQTERQDLTSKIRQEVGRIVAGLANEVAIAKERESTLRSNTVALEARLSEAAVNSGMVDVKLKELQQEADVNQQLFDSFLARYKENNAQSQFQQPDARILSRAQVPINPSFPKKKGMIALSGAGFLLLGTLLGFIREL